MCQIWFILWFQYVHRCSKYEFVTHSCVRYDSSYDFSMSTDVLNMSLWHIHVSDMIHRMISVCPQMFYIWVCDTFMCQIWFIVWFQYVHRYSTHKFVTHSCVRGVIVVSIVIGGGEVCIAYTSVLVNLWDPEHVLWYLYEYCSVD